MDSRTRASTAASAVEVLGFIQIVVGFLLGAWLAWDGRSNGGQAADNNQLIYGP